MRLKEVREKQNITQNELSNMTLIPASVISMYECNRRQPSIDNLIMLCRALIVSSDYLLELEDQNFKDADKINKYNEIEKILNR